MDKLLTVVVPVYKVEKYIIKCLDSLIVPDELMEQLEVIVVNDGTPDKSAEMAREYEKKYPQTFRVIDKENGGHGSAWNRGLKEATGKYLRFLDSDDWLDNKNLSGFLQLLQKCHADLVFTDLRVFKETSGKMVYIKRSMPEPYLEYNIDLCDRESIASLNSNFHYCTYRTAMLRDYYPLFLEKQHYDDAILFVLPFSIAKTLVYFDFSLYTYLVGREGQSIDRSVVKKNYKDMAKVMRQQIEFANNHCSSSDCVKEYIRRRLSTIIMEHWYLLSLLPYSLSKTELYNLNAYVNKEVKQYKKSRLMLFYKFVPFWLYWNSVNRFLKK